MDRHHGQNAAAVQALTSLAGLIQQVDGFRREFKTLFEWHDGALVTAMKGGHHILLDEISLAGDAVLERLNSVLEPGRALLLAERGDADVEELVAVEDFRLLATMNPGGDFGKRELSPALRNRFTEIWVPQVSLDELRWIYLHKTAKLLQVGAR